MLNDVNRVSAAWSSVDDVEATAGLLQARQPISERADLELGWLAGHLVQQR